MGAEPFFRLLGALCLLFWNILKLFFFGLYWLVTLGKWKMDQAKFAADKAALAAAEQQERATLRSRNTLYGKQE
jgi:hypothetical protein